MKKKIKEKKNGKGRDFETRGRGKNGESLGKASQSVGDVEKGTCRVVYGHSIPFPNFGDRFEKNPKVPHPSPENHKKNHQ